MLHRRVAYWHGQDTRRDCVRPCESQYSNEPATSRAFCLSSSVQIQIQPNEEVPSLNRRPAPARAYEIIGLKEPSPLAARLANKLVFGALYLGRESLRACDGGGALHTVVMATTMKWSGGGQSGRHRAAQSPTKRKRKQAEQS